MTQIDKSHFFQSSKQNVKQKSFTQQNKQGKGFGNAGRPFKATGHKGGISRQGSKRG